MKFKAIFALFNAIIVIAFLFVFLMPLFVIDFDAAMAFWAQNWYLIVVFLAVLALLDSYFLRNWKLFTLLESEDWKSLAAWLHEEIFSKGHVTEQKVRLYANAMLLLGTTEKIGELRDLIQEKHGKLLPRLALLLGLPYLLGQNSQAMINFYGPLEDGAQVPQGDRAWLSFFLAFGYLNLKDEDQAQVRLVKLAGNSKDPLVQMVAIHLGSPLPKAKEAMDTLRTKFLATNQRKRMEQLLEQGKENIHVMLMGTFLTDAMDSLWRPAQAN